MNIEMMRQQDLARRAQRETKKQQHKRPVGMSLDEFARQQEATRPEREARRKEVLAQWRLAVDGRRATVKRMTDVRAWLAEKNLAPSQRRGYEAELVTLFAERQWADELLDELRPEMVTVGARNS
jgi:hypothetical protein